jgi:dinuclear metal center YbgI/SA1388 family protein
MQRDELVSTLNSYLSSDLIQDYCPNGLQIEGAQSVQKITTGVTASQALIDAAIANGSDMLLVHHGYFWKGETLTITGMKQRRIRSLLTNNISLVAYHLPLDVHHELGNNAQLAKLLELENVTDLPVSPKGIVKMGELATPQPLLHIVKNISSLLNRTPLFEGSSDLMVQKIALCTGGGQNYIEQAAESGADVFLTGEVSEQTIHFARENDIGFIAAGHHATERYGVKALGEYIAREFSMDVEFIDIDNPA